MIKKTYMKIFVKAKPSSKSEGVEQLDDKHFVVRVKEPPKQGRANIAIANAIAKHLGVSASGVMLVSGFSSKRKVFKVS